MLLASATLLSISLRQAVAAAIHIRQDGSATSTASATDTTEVPQYFQTKPELFAGPTPTGAEPFLAQTNPAPFASVSYIPPSPIETQEPIAGNEDNGNIFEHMGKLSPYFAGPGFGVEEYPLPEGSEIVWLNMLHRHGARYPTGPFDLTEALTNASGEAKFSDKLSFLNDWTYKLGEQILTSFGRQMLYDNGVRHNVEYGHLYDSSNGSKIIARSTTQDRMTVSAEVGCSYWTWYIDLRTDRICRTSLQASLVSNGHAMPRSSCKLRAKASTALSTLVQLAQ